MRGRVFFFLKKRTGEEIICSAGEKGKGKWARAGRFLPQNSGSTLVSLVRFPTGPGIPQFIHFLSIRSS
jgi:hypothetical protein